MTTLQVITFLVLFVGISALIPIPTKEVGFVYNSSSTDAPVQLDFYIDQLCPFSEAAWPTILEVADFYGPSKLKLITHLFPLPYHRNSFEASKGSHVVDLMTSGSKTYEWIKVIFDNRNSLLGGQTLFTPENLILVKYADLANATLDLDHSTFLQFMLTSSDIEMDTRIGWKYSCSRGVSGTPTFMINDVVVAGSSSWKLADWRKVIDPLLA